MSGSFTGAQSWCDVWQFGKLSGTDSSSCFSIGWLVDYEEHACACYNLDLYLFVCPQTPSLNCLLHKSINTLIYVES